MSEYGARSICCQREVAFSHDSSVAFLHNSIAFLHNSVMDWEFVFVCMVVFDILVALLSGAPVHLPLVRSL